MASKARAKRRAARFEAEEIEAIERERVLAENRARIAALATMEARAAEWTARAPAYDGPVGWALDKETLRDAQRLASARRAAPVMRSMAAKCPYRTPHCDSFGSMQNMMRRGY